MNVPRIFGVVLFLHIGAIALLMVQPGCSSTQPPTASRPATKAPTGPVDGPILTETDGGLEPAFNSGIGADDGRYEPMRPGEDVSSGLEPVDDYGMDETQQVAVSGESFATHTVKRGDTLWGLSKQYGVTVGQLYQANDLNKNSVLYVGQQIRVPTDGSTETIAAGGAATYQPSAFEGEGVEYTVRSGDTLSRIASRHDTTVGAIKAANGMSSDLIRVGQKLTLPVAGEPGAPERAPASPVATSSGGGSAVSADGTHVVQAGEYPAQIARRYGMSTADLLAINGITDPRTLRPGQTLKVKSGAVQPAPTAPTTTSTAGGPVQIRVESADPIVEPLPAPAGDDAGEDVDADALFDEAVEIPVIRMEEGTAPAN